LLTMVIEASNSSAWAGTASIQAACKVKRR
jgi:hypothetical protein